MNSETSALTSPIPAQPVGLRLAMTARNALYLGLVLRIAVAFWNGFFPPSFGADGDASTFHRSAVEFANGGVLEEFRTRSLFNSFLGTFYKVTTPSLFLGSLLSCAVWAASAVVFLKIMRLLSLNRQSRFMAMLIYSLIPCSLLLTSVTLREPYQLFFFNLGMYACLKIIKERSMPHWLLLLVAIVGGGLLHGTFVAAGFVSVSLTLFLIMFPTGKRIPVLKIILILPVIGLILYYGVLSFSDLTNYKFDQGLSVAVETYQKGGLSALEDGRAFYKTSVEIDGAWGMIKFVPVSLFQYLFEPMPWRISSFVDIDLFFENLLRGWLIWRAWTGIRRGPLELRRPLLLVFWSYIAVETVWSVGTINWGTADRHHIPSLGALLAMGFAVPASRIRKRSGWRRVLSRMSRPRQAAAVAGGQVRTGDAT